MTDPLLPSAFRPLTGLPHVRTGSAACLNRDEERRIMCQALAHWEECRPETAIAPHLNDIDLAHQVLAPHLFVLRIAPRFADSAIIHCGGALAEFCGRETVGERIGQVLPPAIAHETLDYLEVASRLDKPMADSGSLVRSDGRELLYRTAAMPLMSPSQTPPAEDDPRHLLGAISFCYVP